MDKDREKGRTFPKRSLSPSDPQPGPGSNIDDFFRGLQPEMRHPKPSPESVAAAMEAAQRLAAEADLEQSAGDSAEELVGEPAPAVCPACGHRNRAGNRFCAMCGSALETAPANELERHPSQSLIHQPNNFIDVPEPNLPMNRPGVMESHHYHHHYHHHYFPGGHEGSAPRGADAPRAESIREDKLRSNAGLRGDMSRAEASVRHMTQEWVLACNTKHLDDLLELYIADALLLRSNYPPVRGAGAVREFFFGVLDAGFGEVELDPLRLDVVGDLAYEAGRCKALVPSTAGKRREERGKYLWVFARQPNGEWKLAVDCWSSDLTLTMLESDVPAAGPVRTIIPRKI